ncbi:MAG: hypothetical protein QNJ03_01275 [Dinoroseobacter sp.]|nr:hypothetical protein [Dinoroseobacter sp.]
MRLREREWMASAAMIARKFDLPVIPVGMRAQPCAVFSIWYFHLKLRDITLLHETLNTHRQP